MSIVPFRSDQLLDEPAPSVGNLWIDLVAPAAELAKMIAGTDFVPAEMRGKPAAVTACVLYGAEIGIGPMQSLAKIDIVKGRPAPRAELARALALAAGHEVWIEDSTNTRVTVAGRRRNSEHVMKVTWTMDDVKRAGLAGVNYNRYPRQMLLARASAELVRQLCPDALGGITLFAEEADDPDQPTQAPAEAPKGTTRRRTPQPAAETPTDPPGPADGATDAQIKRLIASFNALEIRDRDQRLDIIRTIVDRPIETSKDCTRDEAATVIDTLDKIAAGALVLDYDNGTPTIAIVEAADDPTDDGQADELPLLPVELGEQ